MSDAHIDLATPLKVAGGTVSVLMLREPTGDEFYRASRHVDQTVNPEAEALFSRELVGAVCKIPLDALDEVDESITVDAAARIIDLLTAALDAIEIDPDAPEVVLNAPVKVGSVEYTQIGLRPPKTGEMRKAKSHLRTSQGQAAQLQYQMSLVSQVSEMPPQAVRALPASVIMKIAARLELFTKPGRKTGTT